MGSILLCYEQMHPQTVWVTGGTREYRVEQLWWRKVTRGMRGVQEGKACC